MRRELFLFSGGMVGVTFLLWALRSIPALYATKDKDRRH
jgi:hypothetical protein